jgi:hypothetical protein
LNFHRIHSPLRQVDQLWNRSTIRIMIEL